MILHITLPEDWAAARASGPYTASTRGAQLADVGFLHASDGAGQVGTVGRAVYADRPDAFVVAMDEEALADAGLTVRREPGDPRDPSSPLFPHVYGGPVPVGLMNPLPRPESDARVLREDNPEAAALLDAGWTVESTSWGARLHLADDADLGPYERRLQAATDQGLDVRRLATSDLDLLREVDEAVAPDFPRTPASRHDPLPADLADRLQHGDTRAYGAFDGAALVGFTLVARAADRWEVDRTAVVESWRGRGVAQAVKACSLLDTHRDGGRVWGTGGAAVNTASLRMNEALGFVLEPRWLALVPPVGWEEFATAIRAR